MEIRLLFGPDLNKGFVESLGALSPVDLNEENLRKIHLKRCQPHILTYIAVENEKIIGTATLIIEQKFIHGGGKVGHIEDVAVQKDCQLKGVGKNLIEFLVEQAKSKGCYKVILDCNDENVGFYEKCGFYKNGNCMRKNINGHN